MFVLPHRNSTKKENEGKAAFAASQVDKCQRINFFFVSSIESVVPGAAVLFLTATRQTQEKTVLK
jgi:hypothetical protein